MGSLRTEEMLASYQRVIDEGILENGCKLCEKESVQDFENWKIITNDFPYDRVASVHHMIVPKRHIAERQLTDAEKEELLDIKEGYITNNYDYMAEAVHRIKSIPGHFRIHLLIAKD